MPQLAGVLNDLVGQLSHESLPAEVSGGSLPSRPSREGGKAASAALSSAVSTLGPSSGVGFRRIYPPMPAAHAAHVGFLSAAPVLPSSSSGSRGGLRQRTRAAAAVDAAFGLGAAATSTVTSAAAKGSVDASNSAAFNDFLFGRSSSSAGDKAAFIDLTPTVSVVSGALAMADEALTKLLSTPLCKFFDFTDAAGDDPSNKMTGWAKVVPQMVRLQMLFDILTMVVIILSRHGMCGVPLRAWLVAGMLLGYPMTWFVNKLAKCHPAFRQYRLVARSLRKGTDDLDAMKIDGIQLYDRLGLPIPAESIVSQGSSAERGCEWIVDVGVPTMVTGYALITSTDGSPQTDPVKWVFEGSNDGVNWEILDDAKAPQVPMTRGFLCERQDYLLHLEECASVFRGAWFVEVIATAIAFAWLLKGTAWVAAGSELCVDGAPSLYYFCYLIVVVTWSILGTCTMALIASAVAMVLFSQKS
eukprot:TRINITY_DN11424_c0_g1_i6.p1 TRINITY_DN11424_c0_g1~~TRINITY_DN11424_c0_g1_i6.p1  ORF type:complete len:471 (-),score=91.87 TRINITY_DN11424_c0_g1_i6:70-1482(-)